MSVEHCIETFTHQIDEHDCIVSLSDSWISFAAHNGSPWLKRETLLGRSLYEFITGREVQALYKSYLEKLRTTWTSHRFPYRCDSPSCRRFLVMQTTALPDRGVLFESYLVREEPRDPVALLDPHEERGAEVVASCSVCRRIQSEREEWIEVEEALKRYRWFETQRVPRLTHTYCHDCHELLLQKLDLNR